MSDFVILFLSFPLAKINGKNIREMQYPTAQVNKLLQEVFHVQAIFSLKVSGSLWQSQTKVMP